MSEENSKETTYNAKHPVEQVLDANLLELLGIGNVSEDEKHEIYEKAFQIIENRVMARIFEELSPDEIGQWKQIPEDDKLAHYKFLEERGINLLKLYTIEAVIYKAEIASLTNRVESEK